MTPEERKKMRAKYDGKIGTTFPPPVAHDVWECLDDLDEAEVLQGTWKYEIGQCRKRIAELEDDEVLRMALSTIGKMHGDAKVMTKRITELLRHRTRLEAEVSECETEIQVVMGAHVSSVDTVKDGRIADLEAALAWYAKSPEGDDGTIARLAMGTAI